MVSPQIVHVFPLTSTGGNPAPVVLDAEGMSDADMQNVARSYGLETSFVLPATDRRRADFRFRFFVPLHEMEMCGHATIGALWLLRDAGRLPQGEVRIETVSGLVRGFAPPGDGLIRITQPEGQIDAVDFHKIQEVIDVLGLRSDDLTGPILNAKTSRVKTLVPLISPDVLNRITPDFGRMEAVCAAIGSTGLYPFAPDRREPELFHARQFPKASGYPEDAATGIAASALAFGLLSYGLATTASPDIRVRQGEAMGQPSEIHVQLILSEKTGIPSGCLLGGICRIADR